MEWVKKEEDYKVPIKSWCREIEEGALAQAVDLAKHPAVFSHVALMPDCHQGYGMPIGGVIACEDTVIPNAVGVDIGCGMGAVKTNVLASEITKEKLREVIILIKKSIPCGEGRAHKTRQTWKGFDDFRDCFSQRGWFSEHVDALARRNLGTLGGGNHFIEVQACTENNVWLMIHSGSRHLGNVIARFYNKLALDLNQQWHASIPNKDLAFLPAQSPAGKDYITDMNFALDYASENRRKIMEALITAFADIFPGSFEKPINIHHNYAAQEHHFGKNVWIHRKGATSAQVNEKGIIPGSMGTPSYIVEGRGNPDSFSSCSHGAGRSMGRMQATRTLTPEECDRAMEGIVFDRWNKVRRGKTKGLYDLGEAPQAYKNIDAVIQAQTDLIYPIVKLHPLGVVKG